MNVMRMQILVCWIFVLRFACSCCGFETAAKPSPDEVIAKLKEGNARFIAGEAVHPHTDRERLALSGRENQGDHAYATVIACSDSRVPVERIFDAGVMDLFIIRVAGNVCDTDESGSIEYGLAHVNTPVLVVLGHTQCGAVTAVAHALQGKGHALERNIPPLVDNIQPAVQRAMQQHKDIHGDAIIPFGIEENVWQGINDLFMASPATRDLVNSGKVKVVGAIYDVSTGLVKWLPEEKTTQILRLVEANPNRAKQPMSAGGHSSVHAATAEQTGSVHVDHTATASADDRKEALAILREIEGNTLAEEYQKDVTSSISGNVLLYCLLCGVIVVTVFLVLYFAKIRNTRGQVRFCWTLGGKLAGGFGVILILLTALSVFSLVMINRVGEQVVEIADEIIPVSDKVAQIEVCQLEQSIALERIFRFAELSDSHSRHLVEQEVALFEKYAKQVDSLFEECIAFLAEMPASNEADASEMSEIMNNLSLMEAEHKTFDAVAEKTIELLLANKKALAHILEETVERGEDEFNHEVEQFVLTVNERRNAASKQAESDEKRAASIVLITSVLVLLFGYSIMILLTRSIVSPIKRAIDGFVLGAEQVSSAAGQMSEAAQSLAEGATEQAAGLEETSSSLEEISTMTRQNADNAQQANLLATETRHAAGSGTESMERLSLAITEIRQSSVETAKIIKVVDEIAFQTNLLALNAAVEAARAGEAGKGFAVVAEEVRNLAIRSAEAAKNTATLIEVSVQHSETGSGIADEVDENLEEIVSCVAKTSDLVSEIAAANQEQSLGIGQINTALMEIDKATQNNAAHAEESASVSEELNSQVMSMKHLAEELATLINGTVAAH